MCGLLLNHKEEKISPLKPSLRQPCVWSVSNFVFLAFEYERRRLIPSLAVSSSHRQCTFIWTPLPNLLPDSPAFYPLHYRPPQNINTQHRNRKLKVVSGIADGFSWPLDKPDKEKRSPFAGCKSVRVELNIVAVLSLRAKYVESNNVPLTAVAYCVTENNGNCFYWYKCQWSPCNYW